MYYQVMVSKVMAVTSRGKEGIDLTLDSGHVLRADDTLRMLNAVILIRQQMGCYEWYNS